MGVRRRNAMRMMMRMMRMMRRMRKWVRTIVSESKAGHPLKLGRVPAWASEVHS